MAGKEAFADSAGEPVASASAVFGAEEEALSDRGRCRRCLNCGVYLQGDPDSTKCARENCHHDMVSHDDLLAGEHGSCMQEDCSCGGYRQPTLGFKCATPGCGHVISG